LIAGNFNLQMAFVLLARLEVFTGMEVEVVVFWIVTPCSDVVGYHREFSP
jgi:hypothetical protein